MHSITYILNYNNIKYEFDRNDVGEYFLDTCKLVNHHFMLFDVNGNLIDTRYRSIYEFLKHVNKCEYKF